MKKHQSVKNPPLLYIVQPEFEPVLTSMQKTYVMRKNPPAEAAAPAPAEPVANEAAKKAAPVQKEQKLSKPLHSFNDLSNEEKLQLLLHLPDRLSSLNCSISTNVQTYIGKVTEFKDNCVTINGEKVKLEDIQSITLKGL
ncbi:CotO family spore coat protein [Metabacillus indicus]|uniref:CotO family spore coat protein n=1 Tax=Metabacillus indicus TaxID=246786 RepID=UPI003CEF0E97